MNQNIINEIKTLRASLPTDEQISSLETTSRVATETYVNGKARLEEQIGQLRQASLEASAALHREIEKRNATNTRLGELQRTYAEEFAAA